MPIKIVEDRIQPGTKPSLGYADRYPKVDMPASVLEAQRANQNISSLPTSTLGGGGGGPGFLENFGNKLTGIVEAGRDYATPAWNLAKGIAGFQDPKITDTMRQDLIERAEAKGGDTGTLGYEDFGLKTATPGGRFTGGLFNLIKDPAAFGNVGSVGRVSYDRDPETGEYYFGDTKYDFTPDPDTGSTGSALLDFINEGGIRNTFASLNFGSKAAAGEIDDGWTINYPDSSIIGQNIQRPNIAKLMQMSRRKKQLQNFKNIEAAEAAKKKIITTTPKGSPSITQKKTKPKVTGPTYGPHKKTKVKVKAKHSPHGGGPGGYTPPKKKTVVAKHSPHGGGPGSGGGGGGGGQTAAPGGTGKGSSYSRGNYGGRGHHWAKGGLVNLYKYGGFLG